MLIEETALKHWIDNFYGYGSWHARFWFVSYEEGGGDVPEEVADKLNYFRNAHPQAERVLCDIRELYKHVFPSTGSGALRRAQGPTGSPSSQTSTNTVSIKMRHCMASGKISSRLYTATVMRNFQTCSPTSNTLFRHLKRKERH
jgi:hypothetical protein